MREWFYHVTCFAKVSLLLLKSCNIKVIITFRFIIKKLAHIKWDVIIPSSLRLLLEVWIWYRCQNRKLLSPLWTIIRFLYKNYIPKHRVKSFILQEMKDSNLLYLTKTALKNCHIQHEDSWLRWIVIVQVNYK